MAIKPDDCVILVENLVVGTKEVHDWDGRKTKIPRYEKYWENFCEHVDKIRFNKKWDYADDTMNDELKKFGGKFKYTKEYKGNYVKFKSHKHLTMFIMRWS